MLKRLMSFLILLAVARFSVVGQEGKQALMNADVINMVKAGLPEKTVILAIEQSSTKFDLRPAALIELKNQGVPQSVMEAMLRTGSSADTATPQDHGEKIETGHPGTKGADGTEILAEGAGADF
jgi:hypothetical protein